MAGVGVLHSVAKMFEDLYDNVSMLFSRWWPAAPGEITEVLVERIRRGRGRDRLRLAIAYKFFVGSDGPYTGESFWKPLLLTNEMVIGARRKLRACRSVKVRFRRDDPSVNCLDPEVWKEL